MLIWLWLLLLLVLYLYLAGGLLMLWFLTDEIVDWKAEWPLAYAFAVFWPSVVAASIVVKIWLWARGEEVE
jgi:hypothetical protein